MLAYLWTIAVLLCVVFTFLHPTKEGFLTGLVFLPSIVVPEIFQSLSLAFHGLPYFTACLLAVAGSLFFICKYNNTSSLSSSIQSLLILEVALIAFCAIYAWGNHWDVYVSNYIFDITGVSLAATLVEDYNKQNWLQLLIFSLYYLLVAATLFDRRTRKEVGDGNGCIDFMVDKRIISPLHLRGLDKC